MELTDAVDSSSLHKMSSEKSSFEHVTSLRLSITCTRAVSKLECVEQDLFQVWSKLVSWNRVGSSVKSLGIVWFPPQGCLLAKSLRKSWIDKSCNSGHPIWNSSLVTMEIPASGFNVFSSARATEILYATKRAPLMCFKQVLQYCVQL